MLKTVILIGGVPGTGKTTLSYYLASKLECDKVINLDVTKNILLAYGIGSEDKYFKSTTHESYLIENLDPVDGFIKHCESFQMRLMEFIDSFKDENILIIEGAQLTPDFIGYFPPNEYQVFYFNLYSETKKMLMNRYDKKLRIRHYPWKENIDVILKIQDYLRSFKHVYHIAIQEFNYSDSIYEIICEGML